MCVINFDATKFVDLSFIKICRNLDQMNLLLGVVHKLRLQEEVGR